MAVLVPNAAAESEAGNVRVEFHSVPVPHGELLLEVAAIGLSRSGIPSPYLVRVQEIQPPRELAAPEFVERTDKVAIDIVRVILVFHERTIGEEITNPNLPELPGEDLQVVDQVQPPLCIPRGGLPCWRRPECEDRTPQLIERSLIVAGRQKSVGVEGRNG
jgi:hypothetical protein